MGFWIFMLICNLLIPVIMIFFGRIMQMNPPKKINGVYGYRTTMSMKNTDTWNFAQKCCGRLWWKTGWGMLILTILIWLPFMAGKVEIVGTIGGIFCTVQCAVLIGSVFGVEIALKKTFDKDGNRRDENDRKSI